jgi:hypothetical protein
MPSATLRGLNLLAQLGGHPFQDFVLAFLQRLQRLNVDLRLLAHHSLSLVLWYLAEQ